MDSAAPDAPARSALTTDALEAAVRTALAGAYALPIVVALDDAERIAVLAGKPLELARGVVGELHGADAAARIVELDYATLPWFAVPETGLRLWRQHGREAADGELVTELEAGDPPVQVVAVIEDAWTLLRLADGAQGWVSQDGRGLDPADAPRDELADGALVDVDRFIETAESFVDVPYVWGGTTDAGVDCSGLVQRAAWRAGGCWLPRHSRALLTVGARVAPSKLERGDVLVLQRDPKTYEAEQRAQLEALAGDEQRTGAVPSHGPAIHPMHVAIALSADEVLHASRDAMRVTHEPLASLKQRYRVLGVRRLGVDA
ncbi:MAG: pgdS [Thermoleophilia bacterium]|nr:pgdS [Thermoleophilia bacterium]